jgi:hypothetical protein
LVLALVHPGAAVSHAALGADWIVVAVVGSALAPEVKVVEVAVTSQPAPEPVASPMSNASRAVTVWLVPFSVAGGKLIVVAGVPLMNARLPALKVTDATVAAAALNGSAPTAALASSETAASHKRPFLTVPMFVAQIAVSLPVSNPNLSRWHKRRQHRPLDVSVRA